MNKINYGEGNGGDTLLGEKGGYKPGGEGVY